MNAQLEGLTEFIDAKADVLKMAREAIAVDGVINGRELEDRLVSRCILISF